MHNMVLVEGGTFMMGSDDGYPEEMPLHKVTLSSFLIGKYEVTQELWESVMGNNPSYFKGSKRPVERVNWYDVVEFCNKLSDKESLQKAYTIDKIKKDMNNRCSDDLMKWIVKCDFDANGYRLPTESEWEYAARGGKKSMGYEYSGSNNLNDVGWYGASNNSGNRTKAEGTSEVGRKQPNELGLHDMSGNVWDWCWDWDGDYSSVSQTNPRGQNSGYMRVIRGGSWGYSASYCRVAGRYNEVTIKKNGGQGLRLVRTSN